MTSHAEPIAASQRIFTLDAVRGVALLGICIMNMPWFNTSFFQGADGAKPWPAWWDRAAETLRDVLFSGKFNSMFSMLFAIGFTIQLERLERDDRRRALGIYLRRIGWLLVFGVVHASLFWTGDVLHVYAVLGLVLLGLRSVPERWLWFLFVVGLLYPAALGAYRLSSATPEDIRHHIATSQLWEASNNAAYGAGTFVAAAREHRREMWFVYTDSAMLRMMSSFYAQLASTLILGLILGRRRFFQQAGAHVETVKRAQYGLLGLGLLTGVVFGVWSATVKDPSTPTLFGVMANLAYCICRVSIMAFYVATIVRAAQQEKWRQRLAPLATAGRMPLTNYLMQTLLATFLFYGWGLGLWGNVGPALDLLIAVGIFFLIQVPLSGLWLRYYELGPMERLWRRVTYGRVPFDRKLVEGQPSA